MASRFAGRASQGLEAAKRALRPDQFERGDYSRQLSIWRILADLHGNDALHVIIRTLFYFQLQSGKTTLPPMAATEAQIIHDLTIQLVEAVTSGAVDATAELMRTYESVSRGMRSN